MNRQEQATHKKLLQQRDAARSEADDLRQKFENAKEIGKREAETRFTEQLRKMERENAEALSRESERAASAETQLHDFKEGHKDSIATVEREVRTKFDLKQKLDASQARVKQLEEEVRALLDKNKALAEELVMAKAETVKDLRKRLQKKTDEVTTLTSNNRLSERRLSAAKRLIAAHIPMGVLEGLARKALKLPALSASERASAAMATQTLASLAEASEEAPSEAGSAPEALPEAPVGAPEIPSEG